MGSPHLGGRVISDSESVAVSSILSIPNKLGNRNPSLDSDSKPEASILNLFPCEVVGKIVEMISGDTESLASCNLVSRCFNSICKSHLFSTVKFALSTGDNILRQITSNNAEIFYHIRHLQLSNPKLKFESRKRKRKRGQSTIAEPVEMFLVEGLVSASRNRMEAGLRVLDMEKVNLQYLRDESWISIMKLIKSSKRLHSLSLPVSSNCPGFVFILNFLTTAHLKRFKLSGKFGCNHLCQQVSNELIDLFKNEEVGFQNSRTRKITVDSLHLVNVGEHFVRYLLKPECPLDLSNFKELHIVGIRPIWLGLGHIFNRADSLIWDIHNFPFYTDLPITASPTFETPTNVHLRCFTLCPSPTSGINPVLEQLKSRFGTQFRNISQLNLVYLSGIQPPSLYLGSDPQWRLNGFNYDLELTLIRADNEFKKFWENFKFPNLEKINLLIGHIKDAEVEHIRAREPQHRVPSKEWEPSGNWPLVCEHAPSLHKTGKLFLRTASFDGLNMDMLLEKFTSL